jgi:hypothetical protein
MALEIIIRRRRAIDRPPETGSPDTPAPPESVTAEQQAASDPANDNSDGAWPFIPFPEG